MSIFVTQYQYGFNDYTIIGAIIGTFLLLMLWVFGLYGNNKSSLKGWQYFIQELYYKNKHTIYMLLVIVLWISLTYVSIIPIRDDWKMTLFFFGFGLVIWFTVQCYKYRIVSKISEIPIREVKSNDNKDIRS